MFFRIGEENFKEFNNYQNLSAYMTTRGTSWPGMAYLVNTTSGSIIGRWAHVDSARTIVGPIDFTNVTTTPFGVAASVLGVVITVNAGHNLSTMSKVLRAWNVTTGALISDVASDTWSVVGDDVTVDVGTAAAVAAALGAGNTVNLWVEGVSELCIGDSSCAIQPMPDSYMYFNGGEVCVGESLWRMMPIFGRKATYVNFSSYTPLVNIADANTIGYRSTNLVSRIGVGFGVHTDLVVRNGQAGNYNGSAVSGVQTGCSLAWTIGNGVAGGTYYYAGGGSLSTNTGAQVLGLTSTYSNGISSFLSTLGAVVSSVSC